MTHDALPAWQFSTGLDAAAFALAALAVWVALDFATRLEGSRGRAAWPWLAGAAAALGTGVWAVHFTTLGSRPLPFAMVSGGVLTSLGWLVGGAAAAVAFHLGWARGAPRAQAVVSAALLAGAAVLATVMHLLDLRVAPAPAWRPGAIAAALAVLGVALLIAGRVATLRADRPWRSRLAAAGIAAAGLVAGDRLATLAAQLPPGAVSLNPPDGVTNTTLALLAALGGGTLLGALLLLSVIEGRMRRALQAAIARIDEERRTDTLTRLPNRVHFDHRLEAAARRADQQGESLALLFVGIDSFKTVNDSFGRAVGDQLLREIAARLRRVCDDAALARAGGDEFVMLLAAPSGGRTEAALAAQRLLETFAEPFELEGRNAPMSCSIGVVLYPQDGHAGGAMARAEAAARYAKRAGGATFAFFEPRMLGDAREQVDLLRDLRQAVSRDQLELYFQPKIHAPSGEITGAEALLRWHHPERGMVSPAVFVPIAERHGLIGTLGQWVIEQACRQVQAWREQGLRMRVAINLSVHQLRQPDLADRIAKALKAHQVNPQLLTCEITESVAMEDAEGTRRVFEKLAGVGVNISIDDFGTGYSSLAYLRKLPAGELKIDRSFVLDLETSADARAVVDAVVKLAQALGLKVVAEGVETEAQNQVLRSLGCDELQGYLFAKPMSAKALALWAMSDVGPRALGFRESLFAETAPAPLH